MERGRRFDKVELSTIDTGLLLMGVLACRQYFDRADAGDSTIRALVQATVENSGFECRVSGDGGEALELLRNWQPDLAVLDVNMPNKNGFEVLSSVRNDPVTRDIRVILLTARQQETDVMRGFGLGADDYVIKPFSPMELIARVKRLLGKTA